MSRTVINTRMLGSGGVRAITTGVNATRTTVSSGSSLTLLSFSVNKLSATSNILVTGNIAGFTGASESRFLSVGVRLGSGTEVVVNGGGAYVGGNAPSMRESHVTAVISGHSTTGAQNLVIRFFTQDSAVAQIHTVLNPNSTDDARFGQTRSTFAAIEYEP